MARYEVLLPVYKQGDDLAKEIRVHGGDVKEALLSQAKHYDEAARRLRAIARHNRVTELSFQAMTHSIDVEGPRDLLEELSEKNLVIRHDDDEEELTALLVQQKDGWYYSDGGYPEEGQVGPFDTEQKAIEHLADAGYAGYVVERKTFTADDLGESAIAALRDRPVKNFEPELTPVPPGVCKTCRCPHGVHSQACPERGPGILNHEVSFSFDGLFDGHNKGEPES